MIAFAVSQRMLEAAGLYPAAEFQLFAGMHETFTSTEMPKLSMTFAYIFPKSEVYISLKVVKLLYNANLPFSL